MCVWGARACVRECVSEVEGGEGGAGGVRTRGLARFVLFMLIFFLP